MGDVSAGPDASVATRRAKRTARLALGVSALCVAAVVVLLWRDIAARYHLFRLRRDEGEFASLIAAPEGSARRLALQLAARAPDTRGLVLEALLDALRDRAQVEVGYERLGPSPSGGAERTIVLRMSSVPGRRSLELSPAFVFDGIVRGSHRRTVFGRLRESDSDDGLRVGVAFESSTGDWNDWEYSTDAGSSGPLFDLLPELARGSPHVVRGAQDLRLRATRAAQVFEEGDASSIMSRLGPDAWVLVVEAASR